MSNLIWPGAIKGYTYSTVKTPEWNTLDQTAANGYSLTIAQQQNPLWHWQLVYGYLYDTFRSPQNTQPFAPYSDFQRLMGFFLAMKGKYDDFLFPDPEDFCADGLRSGTWQPTWPYVLGAVVIDARGFAQLVTTPGTSANFPPSFSSTVGAATPDGSVVFTNKGFYPDGWPNAPTTLQLVTDGLGNYFSPLQRNVGGLYQEDITDLVPDSLQVYSAGAPTANYLIQGPGLTVPGAAYAGLYLAWTAPPALPVTATFEFYFRVQFEEDTQDFERWARGLWAVGGNNSSAGSGYLKLKTKRSARI